MLMGPEHAETSSQPSTGGILSVSSVTGVCELEKPNRTPGALLVRTKQAGPWASIFQRQVDLDETVPKEHFYIKF